jgi:hypothetical protein
MHRLDHRTASAVTTGLCVWLPCTGADPLVRAEEHALSFTDYLRLAFENKGFTRAGQQGRANRNAGHDQLTDASGWLASVEYEQLDF